MKFSDRPLSIPLGIDAQSAVDTAHSGRETNRTRHFARRFHYVRLSTHNGSAILFKVQGTTNPSNLMTKVLDNLLRSPYIDNVLLLEFTQNNEI
jgi:hypothetical protein